MTVNENRKQFEQWTLDYQNQKERADRLFSRISTFRILTLFNRCGGLDHWNYWKKAKIICDASGDRRCVVPDRLCSTCEMAQCCSGTTGDAYRKMGGLPAVLQSFYRWMAEV